MAVTLSKEYKKLIEKFPLRPIRDAKRKTEALALMRTLALRGGSLTDDESDYLAVLGRLIADYEQTEPAVQAFLADVEAISPAEALAYLMEENNLTQTLLASELGIDQGNLSSFLSGKRGLSKANVVKLAHRFRVSEKLFLPR